MNRISFYIDGFNVYHRLNDRTDYHKYKWLDYDALARAFLKKNDQISEIYYFTAYRDWIPESHARHQNYIAALRTKGIKPIFGKYKRKTVKCKICQGISNNYLEEKETDVNIALQIVLDAVNDKYDTAIIVSADSDLIPAIRAVHQLGTPKQVGILLPPRKQQLGMHDLKAEADFTMKMKEYHLKGCQLPDSILVGNATIVRPKEWT